VMGSLRRRRSGPEEVILRDPALQVQGLGPEAGSQESAISHQEGALLRVLGLNRGSGWWILEGERLPCG